MKMSGDVMLYFTIDDVIKKYKNNNWSKNDETFLLSNADSMEYSTIAHTLNKNYDDVIYRLIKNIMYKEYVNDIFNRKYRDKEGNRILRQKYKLDYLTDTEVEKIFIN